MTQPVIVLAGLGNSSPQWAIGVRAKLAGKYKFILENRRDGYINRLVDNHATLVIVDGTSADRHFWTTTPKANPETMSIPTILIVDDVFIIDHDKFEEEADVTLGAQEFLQHAGRWVRTLTHLAHTSTEKRSGYECTQGLPDLAMRAIIMFNNRQYYQQHDLLEELWKQTKSPIRQLYQGILQAGIGYYHIQRGNRRGAIKMLMRSLRRLETLPDTCQGIDVRQLRVDVLTVYKTLSILSEDDIDCFDNSLLKPVIFVRKVNLPAD